MKKFTIVLISILFFSFDVFSSFSRVASLGVEFWMIEEDDTLIWFNPYETIKYPNYVWMELGKAAGSSAAPNVNNNLNITDVWGGASFSLKNNAVVAAFVGRPYWGLLGYAGERINGSDVQEIPNSPSNTSMLPLALNNRLDIFYAGKVFNIPLGFSAFIASNSSREYLEDLSKPDLQNGDSKYLQQFSSRELWLMVGTKLSKILLFDYLDLVLNLGLHSVNNLYEDEVYDGDDFVKNNEYSFVTTGNGGVELSLRGVKKLSKVSIVSLFDYYVTNLSNEFIRKTDDDMNGNLSFADGDTYYKISQDYINGFLTLGAATNLYLNKFMWVFGINMVLNHINVTEKRISLLSDREGTNQEYRLDMLNVDIPFYIALEYKLSKFFTLYSGLKKTIYNLNFSKVEDPDYGGWNGTTFPLNSKDTYNVVVDNSNIQADFSFGTKISVLENLCLELVLRENVLFTGTYLISGVPETLSSQITVTYRF